MFSTIGRTLNVSVPFSHGDLRNGWLNADIGCSQWLERSCLVCLWRNVSNCDLSKLVAARSHMRSTFFCCFCDILVTAMLLTGGSAVINNLTGASTATASGVVVYTLFGGIKATFITDYIDALMILIIVFVYAFTIYTANHTRLPRPRLGGPTEIAAERPVDGNAGGSYLTMRSQAGAEFFVINLIGNFGTVFLDNSYYNKATVASPVDTLPGLSNQQRHQLVCRAVAHGNDDGPGRPGSRKPSWAIMNTYSSELIAVSSICTYIYRTYVNPGATGRQLMRIDYIGVASSSPAVLPATLTLILSGQSWAAATFSPILGLACSMAAWLVTAEAEHGELLVAATEAKKPMLAGNAVSLLAPVLSIPLLTYIPPFRP
ncbi:hypothetical protein MAPG_01532 [Magnaporthiopsis poae ATCC 64411]|uniref:Uncharacterized protein n=1 Tax=Magnaporthiopsis poae (strain ATCC 64411 / 73-15) TaxID=644358 RepID=A0A0C4DNY3_MAGP6|nr:hypothetical protein MAPG_01532 [Magnaporthiopsis poae ATCC 64411]